MSEFIIGECGGPELNLPAARSDGGALRNCQPPMDREGETVFVKIHHPENVKLSAEFAEHLGKLKIQLNVENKE